MSQDGCDVNATKTANMMDKDNNVDEYGDQRVGRG